MSALKNYGLISIDSALHFPRSNQLQSYKRLLSLSLSMPNLIGIIVTGIGFGFDSSLV